MESALELLVWQVLGIVGYNFRTMEGVVDYDQIISISFFKFFRILVFCTIYRSSRMPLTIVFGTVHKNHSLNLKDFFL